VSTTLPTVLISGASEELTGRIEQLIRSQAELSLVESITPDAAYSETFKAKLVWVELESDPEGNVALLEHLIKEHPNTFFVVSKEDLEPELVKRAMQVGALDFLDHKGWAAQIRSVVRRIMAKEFGSKPSVGGPATARQPSRQSSWGQLNSVKVQPNSTGFRRVEPNRAAAQQPTPQAAPKPAPAAPARPAPVVPPPPPPPPEPEEEEVAEVEAEAPYEEQPAYEDAADETAYAEPGEEVSEESVEYTEQEEVAYAGEEGEYEGDVGYDNELPEEQAYAPDADYTGDEVAYAEETGEEIAYAQEGEYAAEAAGEEQSFGEPEAEYEPAEAEPQYQQEEEAESTAQTEVEPAVDLSPDQAEPADDDTTSGGEQDDPPAAPAAKPAPKGRWDDLDSIISKDAPKAVEKKPASKWGELGSIQPKVQKEVSAAASSDKKWSDLDAIVAQKSDAEPASGANKWADLDKIGTSSSVPKAKESGSKWGDLDKIGTSSGDSPTAGGESNWGDLDKIGTVSADSPPVDTGNKWGDLDSIGSAPKAFGKTEGPSSSKWGDLDAIASKPKAPAEPAEGANKWGNLDSIGGKGGGSLKSNTRSFIKPKAPDENAAAAAAKAKWGDLAATPGQSGDENPAGAGGAGGAGLSGGLAGLGGAGSSKWGDLEAIGSGQPAAEPGAGTAPGAAKWGNLDAIQAPKAEADGASAFKNRFGKKTQQFDMPGAVEPSGLAGGAEESKWGGDLNSIPTPKNAEGAGAAWSNLDAIPTPKAEPTGPKLVEGALPKAVSVNEESKKWKSAMSTDLSTGAREMVQMRDKIKETKINVKLGWSQISIVLAVAIIASAGYLSVAFFTFPEPPPEQAAPK
jgi:DNA-binding NarL/FixJ family response regulator